ncbi:type II toxin-antitoxin system RelE/ParE family toxin [Candidatus Shapirobacteria bacterium]|nr:type II toxin-antitoxin system RelE/ParE family toxin [Candidatus Shapirobacteria bacterium]
MNYELVFYVSNRGENLVQDFIESQNQSTRSKYARLIALLIQHGPTLHFPYSRKLTKNLYELRSQGDTKIRIIYTQINQKFTILHAFKKKSQKTPPKEIKTAEQRRLTLI